MLNVFEGRLNTRLIHVFRDVTLCVFISRPIC
jgi:hypothetical protein